MSGAKGATGTATTGQAAASDRLLRFGFWAIAVIGTIVYLAVLSNGTFSLFAHEWMGLAYNDYFLSMADGRLDIPADHIRHEGFYTEDGKVYTYFGALPALLRALWAPFVDLSTTDVSRASLWLVLCLTAVLSQLLVLRVYRRSQIEAGMAGAAFVLLLWAFLWFAGPSMLLAANASIYHQPLALGYLLVVAFLLVVATRVDDNGSLPPGVLPWLALLAGLAVHARPNIAIGLYVATLGFCVLALWQARAAHGGASFLYRGPAPRMIAVSLLVLLAAGLVLLWMNQVRWGNPLMTAPMDRYGVRLFVPGHEERFAAIDQYGSFNLRRVPANLAIYFASWGNAHSFFVDALDTGFIRLERPFRSMLAVWLLPLFLVLRFAWRPAGAMAGAPLRVLGLGTGLIALFVLAFQTITFRYMTDLFPVLFVLMLAGLPSVLRLMAASGARTRGVYLIFLGVLAAIGVVFMMNGIAEYKMLSWFAAADSPVAPMQRSGPW